MPPKKAESQELFNKIFSTFVETLRKVWCIFVQNIFLFCWLLAELLWLLLKIVFIIVNLIFQCCRQQKPKYQDLINKLYSDFMEILSVADWRTKISETIHRSLFRFGGDIKEDSMHVPTKYLLISLLNVLWI